MIPKANARDLSLIQRKLAKGRYQTFDAVTEDVRLMVNNAVLFNGPLSEVAQAGKELQAEFEKGLDDIMRKRKSNAAEHSSVKRVKIE